jgi:hypothetical protein
VVRQQALLKWQYHRISEVPKVRTLGAQLSPL